MKSNWDEHSCHVTYHHVYQQTTAMSSCGNFAITGDARGHVDMFNIQSGIHRGCLGTPKGWFLIKCLAWLLIKKFVSLHYTVLWRQPQGLSCSRTSIAWLFVKCQTGIRRKTFSFFLLTNGEICWLFETMSSLDKFPVNFLDRLWLIASVSA